MAYSHILVGAGTKPMHPAVRRISASDLLQALTHGYNDFAAMPSHAVFLCVIYPLLGHLLIAMTLGYSMPLAFPLAAGFALIGPLAAIGLYELVGAGRLGSIVPRVTSSTYCIRPRWPRSYRWAFCLWRFF